MADDWKYAVEDFEDADESDKNSASAMDTADGRATDIFGEAGGPEEIEPGSPNLENTVFVLLGVAIALLVVLGI